MRSNTASDWVLALNKWWILQGLVLTNVPKIKFLILMSGAKLSRSRFSAPPLAANALSAPLKCPSLHVFGSYLNLALIDSITIKITINATSFKAWSDDIQQRSLFIVGCYNRRMTSLGSIRAFKRKDRWWFLRRPIPKGLSEFSCSFMQNAVDPALWNEFRP